MAMREEAHFTLCGQEKFPGGRMKMRPERWEDF